MDWLIVVVTVGVRDIDRVRVVRDNPVSTKLYTNKVLEYIT